MGSETFAAYDPGSEQRDGISPLLQQVSFSDWFERFGRPHTTKPAAAAKVDQPAAAKQPDAPRVELSSEPAKPGSVQDTRVATAANPVTRTDFDAFTVELPAIPVNARRPTVAFLDIFSPATHPLYLNCQENPPLTHGEVSAKAAEVRGYNVLRLHYKDDTFAKPDSLTEALTEVADALDAKTIALGPGDALNISMNQKSIPTYQEASRYLGLDVSPTNVGYMRAEVLELMRLEVNDPSKPDGVRRWLKKAVDSNEAIKRIQLHGVEVVTSTGNDMPDKFDWNILVASTQLAAADEFGTFYPWSSRNSLSRAELGSYELRYEPPDPDKPESPEGRYRLGNTTIYFDARNFGGVHKCNQYFTRGNDGLGIQVQIQNSPGDNKAIAGAPPHTEPSDSLQLSDARARAEGSPDKRYAVAVAAGTSFANIQYFWDEYEALRDRKVTH